jgi:hypothetical protein
MFNQKQKSKKIVGMIFSMAIFLVFANANNVKAAPVTGWIWAGQDLDGNLNTGDEAGLGWISMNSSSCDTNSNGFIDIGNCGGADNNTTPVTMNYSVDIPDAFCSGAACDLTGAAWGGDNMGWLVFNNAAPEGPGYLANGTCPGGNNGVHGCNAYREGDFIKGWARFTTLATFSGAGSGWVHLYDAPSGTLYGVQVSKMVNNVILANRTYAASSADEYGYIDFSRALAIQPPPTVTFTFDDSSTSRTINLNTNPLSPTQTVKLIWSTTNVASCQGKSSIGAFWTGTTFQPVALQEAAGVPIALDAANHVALFTLECTGTDGSIVTKTVNVTTGCYPKVCSAGTCSLGSLIGTGSADTVVCTTLKSIPGNFAECSVDPDCQGRVTTNFKEIEAP